jgi:hypothetical protein
MGNGTQQLGSGFFFLAISSGALEMNFGEREKVCKPIPPGVKFFIRILYPRERVAFASRKNIST